MYYTFGNLIRQGQPQRDGIDILFSQFIADLYTSFARTYNPNPQAEFLLARDYMSTYEQIYGSGGLWEEVKSGESPTLHRLDWPSSQVTFDEIAQCEALGFPLNYYL